jgi:hypothetical protein
VFLQIWGLRQTGWPEDVEDWSIAFVLESLPTVFYEDFVQYIGVKLSKLALRVRMVIGHLRSGLHILLGGIERLQNSMCSTIPF